MFPSAEAPRWWPGFPGAETLWMVLRISLALLLFVFWFLAIVLLPFSRLVVFYPLALSAAASFLVAIYFGVVGAWRDAGSALLAFVVAAVALAAYLAIAERIDPQFDRRREPNPWFWQ